MNASFTILDPTSALVLAHLDLDRFGQVRSRHDLRRAQRRHQRRTRLLKLLA